jgi:PAS domain S-box-containing protein
MTPSVSNKGRSAKWFFNIAYLVIALSWFNVIVKLADHVWYQKFQYPINHLTWDIFFAVLLTVVLQYAYRKYVGDVFDLATDYIRLFRKNPQPMWIYDLKTFRFLAVNDAAKEMYGFSQEEFLSMRITDIRPYEDVPAVMTSTEKVRQNFNHQFHWSGTWRHKKKNGELIYVEVSSNEIIRDGKKCEIVLAYNVTDKILQEQKMQVLNQKLEMEVNSRTRDLLNVNTRLIDQNKVIKSANLELFTITKELQEANTSIQQNADLKSRFVSMASHEFRIPLANIKSAVQTIKQTCCHANKGDVLSSISTIERHTTHMNALLDDVLTIGKNEAKKLEVSMNEVNIKEFISGLIGEVEAATETGHIVHVITTTSEEPRIESDQKFLRNIFLNLLTNAIKYSPDNKMINVNIYDSPEGLCVDVADKGIGINQADQQRIFEPFFRTERTKFIQGTGLGLSIVKKAADLVNARIGVRSEIGHGSTFTVLFPSSSKNLSGMSAVA